jgi:chemotaxis protein MotB
MSAYRWMQVSAVGLLLIASAGMGGCQSKLQAENDALRSQNVELQQQLDAERAARAKAPPPAASTGFEQISGVDVSRGMHGEVNVGVPGDVLFASGSVDLRSSAKSTLNQIASVIKSKYPNQTIRVEGYTDSDPIKKSQWKDNLELSANRAMAVYRQLADQGIDPDRMYAAGFGATHFVAPNNTNAGKAKNRRVEIVVVQ